MQSPFPPPRFFFTFFFFLVLCTFILQLCRAFELSANDMRFSGENNADSSCLFGAAAPRQAFKPLHSCTTVSGVE